MTLRANFCLVFRRIYRSYKKISQLKAACAYKYMQYNDFLLSKKFAVKLPAALDARNTIWVDGEYKLYGRHLQKCATALIVRAKLL